MVLNPMIKQVIINLHSKYEHSSVHSCREIFDEKCHPSKYGWKENWTNTRRISRRRLVPNPTIQQVIINLRTKYENSSLHSCWEIFDEIFHQSMEGKKIGQIKGRISRRRLVLNPTILQVAINLHTKYEHSSLHDC